jgi:hypothetical protein
MIDNFSAFLIHSSIVQLEDKEAEHDYSIPRASKEAWELPGRSTSFCFHHHLGVVVVVSYFLYLKLVQ